VPETLVEIYPQWRDHEYFVVRDEVVIVDHSHRIVAVVPTVSSSASSTSSESAYASSRSGTAQSINLSQDEVRQLQITLNQRGFNVGEPDGILGARTRAALMQFQQREGLQRSGQIDQQTMSALGINARGQQGAQGSRGPSSTGQAGGTQQPSAANPSSGAGMNAGAGGTSSGAAPSTSGQSGATGNTMQHPSAAPGGAGTSSPSSKPNKKTVPALEELQAIYDQRSHIPARFRDMSWSSWFPINSRMVSRLKVGRLLLGGDSAHIHSPAGAQGMNTGIQDMINLSWKLALVLKGQAPASLLDTYEQDRLPVMRNVLTKTEGLTGIIGSENPILRDLFNHLGPWIGGAHFIQEISTAA
jgi:peptidoglycan hydrolase-like protein with peptidoglycan-binding domain